MWGTQKPLQKSCKPQSTFIGIYMTLYIYSNNTSFALYTVSTCSNHASETKSVLSWLYSFPQYIYDLKKNQVLRKLRRCSKQTPFILLCLYFSYYVTKCMNSDKSFIFQQTNIFPKTRALGSKWNTQQCVSNSQNTQKN